MRDRTFDEPVARDLFRAEQIVLPLEVTTHALAYVRFGEGLHATGHSRQRRIAFQQASLLAQALRQPNVVGVATRDQPGINSGEEFVERRRHSERFAMPIQDTNTAIPRSVVTKYAVGAVTTAVVERQQLPIRIGLTADRGQSLGQPGLGVGRRGDRVAKTP